MPAGSWSSFGRFRFPARRRRAPRCHWADRDPEQHRLGDINAEEPALLIVLGDQLNV
jgi:hypothetical protein